MNRFRYLLTAYAAAALLLLSAFGSADAQRRNEREVRDTLRSIASQIDDFEYELMFQLRSSSSSSQDMSDAASGINNLKDKVDAFQESLNGRRENRDDVREIVTAAADVDGFLKSNRQNRRVETAWAGVRELIDKLASSYGVSPDWTGRTSNVSGIRTDTDDMPDRGQPDVYRPAGPPQIRQVPSTRPSTGGINAALSGTYALDASRSEKADQALSGVNISDVRRYELTLKLEAPEQLAIDIRGNQVTLASSKADPATFTADGREQTETDSAGRSVRNRATVRGNELVITSLGGETDYTVTFTADTDGRTLKVSRRFTAEYLPETVFSDSVYDKTDSVARLGVKEIFEQPAAGTYSSNDPTDRGTTYGGTPSAGPARTGNFIVPNGTIVTAVLENMIDTKASQNNDRFKMTVQSPDEFRGAVLEGYLSGVGRSGRVSGSSNITFNFERITLRNGQSYEFAGSLQSVKDHQGKTVKVDTEGTAKGDSQTRETVKRGGIGAGLGAIIGAIAGGGKGAAIGAILGGGAGAGSVIAQGREDLQLMKGSTITIQASSPNQAPFRRDN